MFYSHTFLARKGPLGTVWCAAHLQHKLRKCHYISTNVSSTVGACSYSFILVLFVFSINHCNRGTENQETGGGIVLEWNLMSKK